MLMVIQRINATAKGFKPMVFRVCKERVEPIKNKVTFNPDFAATVTIELKLSKKGK